MCFHQAQPQRRFSSLTSCHTHIWQNFLLEDCSSMVRDISAIAWAAGLSQGTAKSGLGLGSRALQKGAEGCVGGPGALLLGCEKWECFIHSRWKYRQRYYLTFVFFVFLTNNFKCSYHVFHHIQFPCTDILFLAGCCLPSSASTALINPLSPHTSL